MKFRWGHICRQARFDLLVTDLEELSDHMVATPNRVFRMPDVCLAFRIDASASEGAKGHRLQLVLTDDQGNAIGDPSEQPFPFNYIGPGYPLLGRGIARLNGWQVPGPGAYSFDFAMDGQPLARLPLTLHPKGGAALLPKVRNPQPIRLRFAHLVESIIPVPSASVSLKGIVEYVPLPPGAHGSNFAQLALVLQIEADPRVPAGHTLRVEMVDGNGQPAKVFDAMLKRIDPSIQRPIKLTPVLGGTVQASLAPVRFNDFLVPPEDYQFRFYLDGAPLGDPLDLSVLAPTEEPPPPF